MKQNSDHAQLHMELDTSFSWQTNDELVLLAANEIQRTGLCESHRLR